jgi:hypothetical protein
MYQASLLWIIASGPIFCQSAIADCEHLVAFSISTCALSARRRTPFPNEGYSVQPYEREQRAKVFLRVFSSLPLSPRSLVHSGTFIASSFLLGKFRIILKWNKLQSIYTLSIYTFA